MKTRMNTTTRKRLLYYRSSKMQPKQNIRSGAAQFCEINGIHTISMHHKRHCSSWCSSNWSICASWWVNWCVNSNIRTLKSNLFPPCHTTDADLDEFLPPMEELLEAPELESLTSSKSFRFLLKLGYEHLFESLNKQWNNWRILYYV